MEQKTDETGKAYAFFNCNASLEEISELMPQIREVAKTPGKLELDLTEDGNSLKEGDEKLSELLSQAKEVGRQYVIDATLPEATNEQTANELSHLLNTAYNSSLYQEKEDFYGDIVYEKGGEYLFQN